MVLGIISEATKIKTVIIVDTKPTIISSVNCMLKKLLLVVPYISAYATFACTPTKIAPTVCAMVFIVKMAIKGLSTSFFSFSKDAAYSKPSLFLRLINVGVMLNNTASKIEHKKEKNIETVA